MRPRELKKQQLVPTSRTKINQKGRTLQGFTQSFEISFKSSRDALIQLQNTRFAISRLFRTILNNAKGSNFVETLKITFTKRKDDKNIYKPAYFNSRAQIVINPNDFIHSLQLSEGSGWIISSIHKHYINTVVSDPLKGSSYIQVPAEMRNPSRGLVNIKNEDNECFRWCHIRYLNLQQKEPKGTKNRTGKYY